GLPMLPISTGNSLATGLAVVSRGELLLPPSLITVGGATVPTVVDLSAVGVITTSNGAFIFFDANGLTPFDLNTNRTYAAPIHIGLYEANGVLSRGDGGFPDYVAGPVLEADGGVALTFANGAWRSEVIDIVINGLIPGLEDVAIMNPGSLEYPVPPEAIGRAQAGDILIFDTADGGCRTTVAEITATGLRAPPNNPCSGATRFAVRADGADRYAIRATTTGYLGRSGPGTQLPDGGVVNRTFNYQGGYYRRSLPFDPDGPTFSVVLGPELPRLWEDWRWSIDVQPEELPFTLRVDSQSVGCSTNVAGSVLWDLDRQAIFSVFPSANGIIELNPRNARNDVLEADDGVSCWR
ncbi:MAG: hypothetical protein H6Q89_5356, partial [Myxococcaceae bacterium]|nr:hypothetical protein [Myxococcaceae bacterium]